MRTIWTSLRHCVVLAILAGPLRAGPVGPDNYDFARFGRPIPWNQGGNFGGWTRASADVNGDRRVDLMLYAQDAESWRTWVALSNGDGTFSPGVLWSADGDWLHSTMLSADLNGDERADLLSLTQRADFLRISVAISNGTGVFQTSVAAEIAGNYTGWTSELGDVNGDLRQDLVLQAVSEGGWLAHVALNRGDGSFAAPVVWAAAGDFHDAHVGVGDFNGDGRTDVAVDSNRLDAWRSWVALSIGDGNFAAPVQWVALGEFSGWTPARADFDGDGRTDLQLWAYDAAGWRSRIARSDGSGSFLAPVVWTTEEFGPSWTFSQGDFNADGASDMVAQRADEQGWQARVAISLGDGTFIEPKRWAAFEEHLGGWAVSTMDVSGDGRTDVTMHLADGVGWREWSAISRPCDTVISNQDDVVSRIAGLPNLPGEQVICFKPGVYEGEILIAGKRDLTFVAPHGNVSIESDSYAFSPHAEEGRDPGAPIQVWESDSIEFDGLTIRNVHRVTSSADHLSTVSRAIEVIRSRRVTIAQSRLVAAGKQVIHARETDGLTLAGTFVECYYFCVDARSSSVRAWGSHFRANHGQIPDDDHAIFWTDHSDQSYVNSTMEFITGKAVFAGVNDFNKNVLEVTGETAVSSIAEGWVAQHPNYDGLNVLLRGTYTDLAEWYFIRDGGWQNNAQVCHEPDVGWAHCVGRLNGVSTPSLSETSPARIVLECRKREGALQTTLAQLGIGWNR